MSKIKEEWLDKVSSFKLIFKAAIQWSGAFVKIVYDEKLLRSIWAELSQPVKYIPQQICQDFNGVEKYSSMELRIGDSLRCSLFSN